MSIKLYQLPEEFNALSEMLALDEGEISATHEELEAFLQNILSTKLDGLVSYIEMLEGDMDNADKRIKAAQDFKKTRSNAIDRIKSYIVDIMDKTGQDKVVGEMAQLTLRKPTKIAQIVNEDAIPMQFLRTKTEVDKKAVFDALKAGEVIEGAELADGKKSVLFKLKSVK